MPAELHEDFGEKIGGAKKDLWKDRGLYTDDLDGMNEREAEKYVKKDNVWKKPDYQAMLDEGIPLGVVYFIKKARDSINASPQYPYRDNTPEKRLDRQKQYIETVRELQSVVEGVRSVEDAMRVCDRFFLDNGYLEKRHGYGGTPAYQGTKKGSDNPAITNKLFRALRVHSPAEFERDYTRQARKEQFGVAKDQKVPRGYELHLYDGKGYSRNRDWKEGTYYVTKGYSILQDNLPTREAALRWAQEHAKGRGKSGKQRFVPPQLEHITRTGPDYRNGQEIVGQHYLDIADPCSWFLGTLSSCATSSARRNFGSIRITPFHLYIVLLFIVGELSDRIPICPSGYAITVTHDGYSVVCKELNAICYSYYTKHIP